jgi:hypothetical protein
LSQDGQYHGDSALGVRQRTDSTSTFALNAWPSTESIGDQMTRELSVDEVVEEIFQSVLATPTRQRRLMSKTFWKQFRVKSRSKERVEQATRLRSLTCGSSSSNSGRIPRLLILTGFGAALPYFINQRQTENNLH